jgi:aspartyl/asparaginyl-tRNA synthetase
MSTIVQIKDVSSYIDQIITIKGQITKTRNLKKISFMSLTDDNSLHNIDIITDNSLIPNGTSVGSNIQVVGKISKDDTNYIIAARNII